MLFPNISKNSKFDLIFYEKLKKKRKTLISYTILVKSK
jgi:hypothetical protein